MSVYAAMIECLDRSVGRLVAGLKERGELDNTLIVFLSDNGGNAESGPAGFTNGPGPIGSPQSYVLLGMNWATLANTPFRRYKHFTHEGGINSPFIAHWPAGIPHERNGSLEKQPGHVIDIMATAVDLAGASIPRSTTATPSCRWKASACGRPSWANRWTANGPSFGNTRGTRPSATGNGSSCRSGAARGVLRHGGRSH